MIFQPHLARLIVDGKKVQTRRPVKPSDDQNQYRAGKRRAVQKGRGKPAEFHILLTDVRRETLGDITLEDAIAEGFRTRAEFASYWMTLHDPKHWPPTHDVICPHCDPDENVIWDQDLKTFIACPHCDLGTITVPAEVSDDIILDRFTARHGHKRVWVLSFILDPQERPRLLARGGGYTTMSKQALFDEPEAVDINTQARITQHAGMLTEQWVALDHAQRELMDLGDRLAEARASASAAGIDVRRIEQSILQRIRAIEAKTRRAA
jgi:uncharacterized protein YhfF